MRIGDFCKTNLYAYSEKEKWSEIHYLDTGNITRGKVAEIQTLVPGIDAIPSRARRKVQVNDIIYSTVRPNQRHYGIIKTHDPNMLVSTGFVVITVDTRIADPDFIYYFLTQDDVVETLEAIGEQSTSAYPSIKPVDIENLEVELPPLEVQKTAGAMLRQLDRKCVVNDEINDNLLQQLRAIFMERFTNNPALESIQQVPLSELCSVVTKGTTPTTLGKPFVDRGINFLKAESILDNHSLDKGKFAHIDEETHDMLKRSVIYAGDIIFTIAGTLGRFALIDSDILPANTNQAVAIIRADKGRISPEYLYACFIGNWHNDYYSKRVQQAVQANLSLTTIKSLPIPVLTQDEMVSYMALISPIIRMLKQNEMENERLAALRDTLLPRLMSGEVDVSNIDI